MGRTARFDQIYVSSLDADPLEQDVLTTVRSIITSEVDADELLIKRIGIANTNPTANISVGTDLFVRNGQEIILDVNKSIRTERIFINDKVGFGTTNPTRTLEILKSGVDKVIVDTNDGAENLFIVYGNTFSSNIATSNIFRVGGTKLVANSIGSNILSISGNTYSTNVQVGKYLSVGNESVDDGSNVALFTNGNVIVENGFLKVYGGMNVFGNLSVTESATYTSVENLVVSNAVIQMGTGNDGSYDTGILMVDEPSRSNIIAGYIHNQNQFVLGRTFGEPTTQSFTVDTSNTMNLHVYGNVFTSHNIGAANTSPTYNLSVGSNLHVDDSAAGTQANLLWSNGYSYLYGMRLGMGGLTIGTAVTVNPLGVENPEASIISVEGNIQTRGIRTTGEGSFNAGIANTNPQDTLSIGSNVVVNVVAANVLTVVGNTVTSRLITDTIRVQDFIDVEGDSGISSSSNVNVHADNAGPDSTSNALVLKAGPTTSNISAVEVYGAKESSSHQNIRFKTKNTERVRIASDGKVGVGTTNATERLTLGGNLKINGSNAAIFGNVWGSASNTSMRIYTDPNEGVQYIEAQSGTNKGINFRVSQTTTMGTPKFSILESGRVGVGTTLPQSKFQTSGGEVFINSNVSQDGGFTHLSGVPLTVTNTTPITSTNNPREVLRLAREGKTTATTNHGVRSTFKLAKFEDVTSTARTRLDIDLAHGSYAATDVNIMTLRSDGRVGVGTHTPEGKFMVNVSGARNPITNGILVSNLTDADANQDAIITTRVREDAGDPFATYMIDNNGSYEGWSVGTDNRNDRRDFRITNNVFAVSNVADTALFIHGSSKNIGIGTDTPREKLEVNGSVVIGNELYFGGMANDEYGNTFMKERLYDAEDGISELLIFKGNNSLDTAGPDKIRSVAGEHLFQVYSTASELTPSQIEQIIEGNSPALTAMSITPSGRVFIGTKTAADEDSLGLNAATRLYVDGGFQFAAGQKFSLAGMDLYTTAGSPSVNVIDSISNRRLSFRSDDTEYARFTENGLIGFGTDPDTNVHIYSALTSDVNLLKLESPNSAISTSLKKTGMLIYTDDGFGGYVKGYRNKGTGKAGLTFGAANASVLTDTLYVAESSNVGIGISTPASKLHVYNGTSRIEHSTGNAILELKTAGGTSNIFSDTTGNVYIVPDSTSTFVSGDLDVTGDIAFGGSVNLGATVGINLNGSAPETALHVNGGVITNSDQVACKKYSNAITITGFENKTLTFTFGQASFYAKIIAILRRTDGSTVKDSSTLILEIQGGTDDASLSTVPIAVGTKNIFGGTNSYPWSSVVTTDGKTVTISPNDTSGTRTYKYDVVVELISSNGGKLESIKSGTVTQSTFTY